MKFKEIKKENGWANIVYAATWRYGYDFMLDAAQMVLADFGKDVDRVVRAEIVGGDLHELTAEVKEHGGKLRECPAFESECSALGAAGVSGVMEFPLQVYFYNQTDVVTLHIPVGQFPEDHPIRKAFDADDGGFEHIFDHYMDSIEIKAYCAGTERCIRKELSGKEGE
ncbi:MAG: hypothetical protein NC299_09455 [Lachnospiraceae bacterium]|nr:hypothetical protein [Ruminococcus sp.]MCM1275580.1 hypothetical protein [Lachnospiraceae bacterium]